MTRAAGWWAALLLAVAVRAAAAPVVEFFFEPGCELCRRVEAEVLPELEARLHGLYTLEALDTGVESNYLRLAWYQEHLGIEAGATTALVVDGRRAFADWRSMRDDFVPYVEEEAVRAVAAPAPAPPAAAPALSREGLRRRFARFTLLGVATAGLVDGINPCAISTLVFFISMLTALHIRGPRLLAAGGAFCAASFLTYVGIGFGLFRVLHAFAGFHALRAAVEAVFAALLVLLAVLSLLDAWRFARTGRRQAVTLRLPERVHNAIHRTIREGLHGRRLVAGGAAAGALVTVLESVCTGQVYLPTLVLMARDGAVQARVLGLLLLYNVFFMLPLLTALALAARGLKTERLVSWSRHNVVRGKLALAALFLALAALMLLL